MLQQQIDNHIAVIQSLMTVESAINTMRQRIIDTVRAGRTVWVCGNGGSAADAQHFAAELTGRYCAMRRAYAAVALTVDTSALTAIANDYGYRYVFARQLEGLAKPDDILLAISTSGQSENILEAVKTAKDNGVQSLALTGNTGGELAKISDLSVVVPSHVTAHIQEAHIVILHYFCEGLEPCEPCITPNHKRPTKHN